MKKFIKDALYELSQVTWLTKDQAIRYSIITVLFVFISSVLLWAIDFLLTEGYQLIQ